MGNAQSSIVPQSPKQEAQSQAATAAAEQTASGNLLAAQQAQAANMINQVTPQGTVTYTPTQYGQTAAGDPLYQWTQNVELSPEQQAMYAQNQAINQQLGNIAQQGVGYVQQALDQPLEFSGMQALQDPGQIQQQASDAAYQNAAQYLDPQFEQQQASMESQLANQGITRGSEAWTTAMDNLARQRQQAYGSARNQAYLQGLQGAGQQYQQGMGTRQQQITEAQTLQQYPINLLNALRTGQQMSVTQQPQVATSSPGSMATTAGADYLGAQNMLMQQNLAQQNAQAAQQGNMQAGLFGLGSAYLMGG